MTRKAPENAVARLKRRITDRIDADKERPREFRRTQVGLAEKIGITKQTLNELLNGPSSKRGLLAHLDAIAEYFGVPPSLMIHKNDTAMMELEPEEYRVLAHWRRFPPSVKDRLMEMFDYFAGLRPEEREARRWWQQIQQIRRPKDRLAIQQAIDEALSAQRSRQDEGEMPAARESFDATESAIKTRPNRRIR